MFNFVRSSVRLSQRLCKLLPITSTSAHQCDTRLSMASVWSVEESVKLIDIVNKNSSGDEIANVNFFYNIAHVEASAYAH